ncbi:MAG: hypothetical protein KF902_15060 [Phycisphaeraceae bacterium]|nr:hypothetical protein [Phycisphaeraceae bacterium]MBX3318175.1 hypothetical protein [Phycisphaeraceae bacterium]
MGETLDLDQPAHSPTRLDDVMLSRDAGNVGVVPQVAGPGVAVLAFDGTGFRYLVVEIRREGGDAADQVGFDWKAA